MKSVNSWLPNWFRVLFQKYFDKARLTKKKELLLGQCLLSEWCRFDRWWLFWISWRWQSVTLCNSPGIWTGQNISPTFWHVVIMMLWKIMNWNPACHGFPFEEWPNRTQSSKPFLQKRMEWPFPVRSALNITPIMDTMFYCIFNTIQKLENYFALLYLWIFCSV